MIGTEKAPKRIGIEKLPKTIGRKIIKMIGIEKAPKMIGIEKLPKMIGRKVWNQRVKTIGRMKGRSSLLNIQ